MFCRRLEKSNVFFANELIVDRTSILVLINLPRDFLSKKEGLSSTVVEMTILIRPHLSTRCGQKLMKEMFRGKNMHGQRKGFKEGFKHVHGSEQQPVCSFCHSETITRCHNQSPLPVIRPTPPMVRVTRPANTLRQFLSSKPLSAVALWYR